MDEIRRFKMANLWKKIKNRERDELKAKTKAVDGTPMIEMMLNSRGLPEDQRKALGEKMLNAFKSSGEICIRRALMENLLTKKDMKDIKLEPGEWGTVLQAVLNEYDGEFDDDEQVKIVTLPSTAIWKQRKAIEERFGKKFKIITVNQAMKIMEREKDGRDQTNHKDREEPSRATKDTA